jgi:hypothetical protein
MRKNYFLSLFNTFNCISNQSGILKKTILTLAILLCLVTNTTTAQTTVIDPAAAGGFEIGAPGGTFAGNGWRVTTTGINRNQWACQTGATAGFSGTKCAYVAQNNTAAVAHTYLMTTVRATHLIKDVTFTAGETSIALSFKWIGVGEVGQDRMKVWLFDSSVADPTYGVAITASAGLKTQIGLAEYSNQATWTTANITIPGTYAGTTGKLIFEWVNNASLGTNPPAAVDDISLTSLAPYPDDCTTARLLTTNSTCSLQSFDNTASTNSADASPGCGSYNGKDLWFRATANCNGELTITTEGNGGLTDVGMALYSGTCGALTLIQCKDDDVFGVDLYPSISLTGLSANQTIYIRVWDYQGNDVGSFDICATAANCYAPNTLTASSITSSTATIGWSPTCGAPVGGYAYVISTINGSPAGMGTATTATSIPVTGLLPYTTYYYWVRSDCGSGNYSAWVGNSFQTAIPNPTTTGVNICQGGTGSLTASAYCTSPINLGNAISGSLNASTDPVAFRPVTGIVSTDPCSFAATTGNYTSLTFTVTVSGTYVFLMDTPATFDAMSYITTGAFVPGNCGGGGTYLAGDDDTGAIGTEPQVTVALTAGTTYTLYTTNWSTTNTTVTASFSYTVSGPGSILATTAGTLQWWTAASGGSVIGSGTPFNPVGAAGSGVANNTTPVSTNFYAACSAFPNIRTGASYVINASPSSVISGTGSACTTTTVSIALSGTSPWTFTYTDGTTPVTITNTSTTPYTFSASPGVATTYTVSALSNATCATTAAAYRTGSAVLYEKVWSGATASWATAGNWTPNGVPTNNDCVVINSAGVSPIISGTNYYAYANKLTVNNSGLLTVNPSNSITVTNAVAVATSAPAGNIILEDDSSLVQITDVGSNNNTGNITFKRTASIQRADYVYWSSPFTTLNASSISPATNPYYIWKWNPSIANANGGQGNWVAGNEAMVVGKGYIVRAPDAHPTVVTDYTATLTGRPNNGIISTPLARGTINAPLTGVNGITITATDDNWNLVGNPYPSSIDAIAFLTQNSNLDGNVRLWTHGSPIGSTSSSFYNSYTWGYADSYLTYNSLGPNPPGFGGKIASGQGFFVSVLEGTPTLSVGFSNTMRQYDFVNSDFFKSSGNHTNTVDKSRIWLSILNPTDMNNTMMVGYMDGATLEKDREYDASNKPEGNLNIYSMIGDEPMNIQGRPAFNVNDIVPIGYSVSQNGIYKIAIADLDGLFDGDEIGIYLEDTLLNVTHDLRSNYYSFTTEAGTFNDRFKLRYTASSLGNSENEALNTLSYINNHMLHIQSIKNIEHVDIFDVTGKLIKSCPVNVANQNFETDFNYPRGVYLLKIKLDNGIYVTKKQLN